MVLRMKESDITRKVSEAGRNIEEKIINIEVENMY